MIIWIYLVGQTCGEDLSLWHCAEDYNRPWSTWLCCPKNLTQWHVRHCCPKNLWSTWSCLLLLVSLQGCDRYLNDTDCLFSLNFLLASDLSSLSNDHRWSHPILGFSQPLKFKMDLDFDLTLQSNVIIIQSWQVDLWKEVQGCSGIAESPGGVSTHESEPLRVCLC